MTPQQQDILKQIMFFIKHRLSVNPLVATFDLQETQIANRDDMETILNQAKWQLKEEGYELKYSGLWFSFINRGSIEVRKIL